MHFTVAALGLFVVKANSPKCYPLYKMPTSYIFGTGDITYSS